MDEFGNGRNKELIMNLLSRIQETSTMFGGREVLELEHDRVMVWCDKGYQSLFKKIPGVFNVNVDTDGLHYCLFIDPRYDTKWVMAEIESCVLTQHPVNSKSKEIDSFNGIDDVLGKWSINRGGGS